MTSKSIYGPAARTLAAALGILAMCSALVALGLSTSPPFGQVVMAGVVLGVSVGVMLTLAAALGVAGYTMLRGTRVGMYEAWRTSELALRVRTQDAEHAIAAQGHATRLFTLLGSYLKYTAGFGALVMAVIGVPAMLGVVSGEPLSLARVLLVSLAMGLFVFTMSFMTVAIPTLARLSIDIAQATAHDRRVLRERRDRVDAREVQGALHIAEHTGSGGALTQARHASASDLELVEAEHAGTPVVLDLHDEARDEAPAHASASIESTHEVS